MASKKSKKNKTTSKKPQSDFSQLQNHPGKTNFQSQKPPTPKFSHQSVGVKPMQGVGVRGK